MRTIVGNTSLRLSYRGDRSVPLLTPIAATVSKTPKSQHACSAERTDEVTYRGDQTRLGVRNYGNRSHMVFLRWRLIVRVSRSPLLLLRTRKVRATSSPNLHRSVALSSYTAGKTLTVERRALQRCSPRLSESKIRIKSNDPNDVRPD
jgi:hypothetical protein